METTVLDEQNNISMIQRLRAEVEDCFENLNNTVPSLIKNKKEMQALVTMSQAISKLLEIHETLDRMYTIFYKKRIILDKYGSERFKSLGYELVMTCSVMKEEMPAVWSALGSEAVKKFYIDLGYNRKNEHFPDVFVNEVYYLLDSLEILIEPDYVPFSCSSQAEDSDISDRYIPAQVKIAVWRRDQGKCTQCSSQERLEYDHIIPISKGGSNTERNIQLLCERCNRQKGSAIGA